MQDVEKIQEYVTILKENRTNAEWHIEKLLKELNIYYIFQYPIAIGDGFYILDFFLPDLNIYIEVDGKQHMLIDNKKYDKSRHDKIKHQWNLKEIRIKNKDAFIISSGNLYRLLTKKKKPKHKNKSKFTLTRHEKAIQQRYDNLKL